MKKVWKVLVIILAALLLIAGVGGFMGYRILYPKAIASGDGENLVICIGDSITYGQGVMNSRDVDSYPAQLAELLGDDYQVINYGLPNRTLQSTGNMPYAQEKFYQESLAQDADIVILMLGSNDSKPDFWNAKPVRGRIRCFDPTVSEYGKYSCGIYHDSSGNLPGRTRFRRLQ